MIVVEEVRPVKSSCFAVTVLVCVRPFFVKSFDLTVITYPEKLRKSVSADDKLMVEVMLGQLPDKLMVFGTVSSISTSERVNVTGLD